MLRLLQIFISALGGRLLLLPAAVVGLVGLLGVAKGLGVNMPSISWWTIAFLALFPLSAWSIVGLVKKVAELNTALEKITENIMYSVLTSPYIHVFHKKNAEQCEIEIGFSIRSTVPILYEVVELRAVLNGMAMPGLELVPSREGMVVPNEKKWFVLPRGIGLPWKPQLWTGPLEFKIVFGPPSEPKKFFLKKKTEVIAVPTDCQERVISESRGLNES